MPADDGRCIIVNESIMENEQYKTALDLLYLVSCSVNGEIPDRARCAEMDFGNWT